MRRVQKKDHINRESGMVSFLITIIMLAVITLIVIGFTQVANRNRRQALDRQLSTQAFYAAESGVNQAVTYIKAQPSGTVLASKTACTSNEYGYDLTKTYKLNTDGSVQTTCLLINSHPASLHGTANLQQPMVLPIDPVDTNGVSTAAKSLTFAWTSQISPANISGCTQAVGAFPASYPNCTYGVIRVDILQYQNASMTGAQNLTDNTTTLYLQPVSAGAVPVTLGNFSGPAKSYIVGGSCTATNCQATVNLDGSSDGKHFYARITALYSAAPDVMITGVPRVGATLYFAGQYVIDSTGRAQDVLRRVAVRYNPLTGTSTVEPFAAIQATGDVCKRLTVVTNTDISVDGVCATP